MKKLIFALFVLATSCVAANAMSASSVPSPFNIPWANTATCNTPYSATCYTAPVPQASQIGIVNCAASLTDGYPPLTTVPVSGGGCGPFIQDFNGILKQITQWSQWQSAGNALVYNSGFSTAINGYPKYATLAVVATPGCNWISTADNNLSDPDTGGANWLETCTLVQAASGGGLATIQSGANTQLKIATAGVTASMLASGAAASNIGSLGGVLTGTLPNPGLAAGSVGSSQLQGSIELPGAPTSNTTPAAGTDNNQIATTAYANPAFDLNEPGYVELSSGLYIEWGKWDIPPGNSSTAVTFLPAFPTGLFSVVTTPQANTGVTSTTASLTVSGFTVVANVSSGVGGYYMAIGF
jgi:hypothetical protein